MASGGVIGENNSWSTHNYPWPVNGILHVRYESNSVGRANHPICRANSVDDHDSVQVILLGQRKMPMQAENATAQWASNRGKPPVRLPRIHANYCYQSEDDASTLIAKDIG